MTNASDAFLTGGKYLLYPLNSEAQWVGRPRGGMIVSEPRTEQQTDINTRAPLFWDAQQTQPKMQLVFDVVCDGSGPAAANGWHTNERVDGADDGRRTVVVKGKDKKDAINGQLSQHGRPGLRLGDHYYECWTGNRAGKQGQARTWAVMLFPGAGMEQGQFFGNEPQPPVQQPSAPAGFGAPQAQQPASNWNAPATGQPPQQGYPSVPQTHAPAAQGNAYGFGHQPPASPGGQAYAAAQQAPSGFGQPPAPPVGAAPNPGPPPQFGQPQQAQAPSGFGGYPPSNAPTTAQPPQGFGAPAQQTAAPAGPPVPPVDDPWGRAPVQQPAANPYGG